MATESDSPKPAPESGAAAPELRLLDRRAFVGFPPLPLTPGLTIADFALQIPDVSFPFNVSAGPSRYQRKKLLFGFLSKALYNAGLYCRADDRGDPVVQLAPPLICDQEHFDEIEQKLRGVLEEAQTKL